MMLLCLCTPSTSQRRKCGVPLFPSIIMALQQHETFTAYEAACSLKGWVSNLAQKVKDACCVNLTCWFQPPALLWWKEISDFSKFSGDLHIHTITHTCPHTHMNVHTYKHECTCMYTYTLVYIYVHIHIYMSVHNTHIHKCTYTFAYMSITYTHTNTSVHSHTYTHMSVHMHIHTHKGAQHIHEYTHTYTHKYTSICIYTWVYIHTHTNPREHTYTHGRTHTFKKLTVVCTFRWEETTGTAERPWKHPLGMKSHPITWHFCLLYFYLLTFNIFYLCVCVPACMQCLWSSEGGIRSQVWSFPWLPTVSFVFWELNWDPLGSEPRAAAIFSILRGPPLKPPPKAF